MKEELLHFIWQSKLLLNKPLVTRQGDPVSVIHPGLLNRNAGPDFFNARIRIGDTLWAGNVEIHLSASDWDQHNHQHDPAYNNVILHVVFYDDKEVMNANGQPLPTIALRELIPTSLLHRYLSLQQRSRKEIPCEKIITVPDEVKMNAWLQRLLIERVERKCSYIRELLAQTSQHWEQSFYIITARYFGMKTNDQPFELLARSLPQTILVRHKNHPEEVLALILGVSGLLPGMDAGYRKLVPLFEHLQKKYGLKPLDTGIWKFSRTRPANFPTERLLQFAALMLGPAHLFSKVLECSTIRELESLYDVTLPYGNRKIAMGAASVRMLLINSVLPFVFWYGKQQHQEVYAEKALQWYEQLPAEDNAVISRFAALGLHAKNAGDGQAYIQLKNEYCSPLKCLSCSIGYQSLLHA
jgi:hypothetical protein